MTDAGTERVRLSELGTDATALLTLIAHFDRLVESGANADTLVRAASLVAGCPVVAWAADTVMRYDAVGDPVPGGAGAVPPADLPSVRVERSGPAHPLDPLLADRLRHALTITPTAGPPPPLLGDPALLAVALSTRHGVEDRVRALGLLGLDPAVPLRVLAIATPAGRCAASEAVAMVRECVVAGTAPTARIGGFTAMLLQGGDAAADTATALHRRIEKSFPSTALAPDRCGPWVGIGSRVAVTAAHVSWDQARRALRFASSTTYGRRAIAHERIGTLALVADHPAARLRADPDVRALDALAVTETGRVDVATFEASCMYGSLRRTAAELHVHHTTVAARLARVERAMGWHLDDPLDRFKAMLALMVRRIGLTSAELERE